MRPVPTIRWPPTGCAKPSLGDARVELPWQMIGGNLVPDAQLAALAIEHGVEIVSADTDFLRYPGVRLLNPLASD